MSKFTCRCGLEILDGEAPIGSAGLLKPNSQQVELEAFQSRELAELVAANPDVWNSWRLKHFGPDYPIDASPEELIEDFLYKSHRNDGCSATFECPRCGRIAILDDVNEGWRFYLPEK